MRAANRLHVAQPALSRQIRDLEREVGVELFRRVARGVRLTPAGSAFLVEARKTIEQAERAVTSARYEATTDTVKLGHVPLFYYATPLSQLVSNYRERNPTYGISVHRLNESRLAAALRSGRIDVAVSFMERPEVEGFHSYRWLNAPATGVMLPASHPLAQQEKVRLAQLDDLTWIHVARRHSTDIYEYVREYLKSHGLVPHKMQDRPRDGSLAAVRIAVGDAWMLATEHVGRMYTAFNNAVVYRPFVEPPLPFWIGLIWAMDDRTPALEKLLETAEETKPL